MSQSKFRTVADYEYGLDVKAQWSEIVRAAGLYNEKQTPESVYLLAGTITSDELYVARLFAKVAASTDEGWPDTILLGPSVLEEMTPAERAGLRARVLAHWSKSKA